MDITIYLPDELGKWAKESDLPLSRMLRDAVEAERDRRKAVDSTLAEAATFDLDVEDRDGNSYTARIHGALIAGPEYSPIEVYLGKDEKVYVYDQSKLYEDVSREDLRDWIGSDRAAYSEAM